MKPAHLKSVGEIADWEGHDFTGCGNTLKCVEGFSPRGRLFSQVAIRWLKFNAVGGIGIGVQLLVLLGLKTLLQMNYLLATALAVETAVIHNFLWHERFTWADRVRVTWRESLPRLLRFNLTTGGVSIVGNLALMRLMVGLGHMNYLLANGIAIALCSLANFLVSDQVVFLDEDQEYPS